MTKVFSVSDVKEGSLIASWFPYNSLSLFCIFFFPVFLHSLADKIKACPKGTNSKVNSGNWANSDKTDCQMCVTLRYSWHICVT
jgi:hypothetical protein